ncbi:hypothetical protein H9Y04_36845 [Streptomyces sp. TRM66268-LWL]|uniref:Helix-turn-helix domain-containing protein n=1 Tax=Streptomyces polyasparticus TaxID=2767826 RepID=A0ABR7ST89_9ACTN|nr:hypothetical protein [Streptomyces polyasparticus]MBC9718109.1 hypothetical protein [Streptomyces polyasparticus]
MQRHAIPPARFFTQVPNEILRHPRLSSDAVRLLTWQLSLPEGDSSPLSRTAEQAGLGRIAFTRAKRQLKEEGYVHEWREQCGRGRWVTRQLVSNVPLSAAEAAAVRDGGASPASTAEVTEPTDSPLPSDAPPAAGDPTPPSVGDHPDEPPSENTSNPPRAAQLVADLSALDGRLHVPRAMLPELTALAAAWLGAGHAADDVRAAVTRGLPATGSPILRPGGLLRYLLKEVPPVRVPQRPRVAAMRECAGEQHVQPMLFRPVDDEDRCGECRADKAAAPPPAGGLAALRGAALARTALRHGHA